ncbi:hypothetical protein N3K66_005059 [Trichothecium roseum]|uniref:Uncharacterized protein n=1 Tax=Trichothecium roseum TaxID=47278 RepID=A0ACC0V3C3_9HYPO|nr:hypothetical protein N3K66_005059 [Trichothecium roseum]
MERSVVRPAAQLLRSTCSRSTAATFSRPSVRTMKTAARTKRALKIAPHPSFQPDRNNPSKGDSIIYNPPSSEATPFHTPFLFLPNNDPRRTVIERARGSNPQVLAKDAVAASEEQLPPEMKYPRRTATYGLQEEEMLEMRKLRNEDPLKWSVNTLARKFNCSPVFVKIAAPAPKEHHEWLNAKRERKTQRWGAIKLKAMENRRRLTEMMYRGELS